MARARVTDAPAAGQADELAIAGAVAGMLARYADTLEHATEGDLEVIVRAASALAAFGDDVPDELVRELTAISICGVDPAWQIAELRKLLDQWAPRQ
jgi:hypothetical protein